MKDTESDLFARKLSDRFDQSVDSLDESTVSAITRARYRALEQVRVDRPGSVFWLPVGALATACLAVLVYSLLPQTRVEEKTFIDEIEIISELDLYEDLEFYEWLEQNEIPS